MHDFGVHQSLSQPHMRDPHLLTQCFGQFLLGQNLMVDQHLPKGLAGFLLETQQLGELVWFQGAFLDQNFTQFSSFLYQTAYVLL